MRNPAPLAAPLALPGLWTEYERNTLKAAPARALGRCHGPMLATANTAACSTNNQHVAMAEASDAHPAEELLKGMHKVWRNFTPVKLPKLTGKP